MQRKCGTSIRHHLRNVEKKLLISVTLHKLKKIKKSTNKNKTLAILLLVREVFESTWDTHFMNMLLFWRELCKKKSSYYIHHNYLLYELLFLDPNLSLSHPYYSLFCLIWTNICVFYIYTNNKHLWNKPFPLTGVPPKAWTQSSQSRQLLH